eukprot:CAMPEP_0170539876 /NCGR_PEP_ID=MMETSP0209-20121228/104275_1 /TAXON_ID=665100 ORGANISM="Litonotus pictus, Strain P1" /NCGR_SAMPLE_ID=MMETSP0209 /ASSEMBLY_ACC=CAM_ASM_000301 /LENGTH=234 /DNA_ID=CAMNT_0010842057 /DNA_START=59 /DNA_END=763 /DNA_ORIENTATION=-
MKLSSLSYSEIKKTVEYYTISGKIPKKVIQSNILTSDSLSSNSPLEENFHSFITNHLPTTMIPAECIFRMYVFLQHSRNIADNNQNLYELLKALSKGKLSKDNLEKLLFDYLFLADNNQNLYELLKALSKGKLSKDNLEKLLFDYLFFCTYKVNFFFESNLKGPESEHLEDIVRNNKGVFSNSNIQVVVKRLLATIKTEGSEAISLSAFNECFAETDISSFAETRDLFYATFAS